MASVTLDRLHKSYGSVRVLSDISLAVADGEFVVLVGPSGCGKSTLLRMLAGLESVSAGEIRIGARTVNDVPAAERDIAMVFQNYALYPHLTVAQNMAFSLDLKRAPKAQIAAKVQRAAAILGLQGLLQRHPRHLSGGQRQRVAMGRAIVRDPQVFLFDEPLSNLDAQLRVQMRSEIKELHQRLGTTTVYVTHDQMEAMTLADRIVVLNGGVVEQVGAPLELYDRPANRFVAGFIGSPSMNFIAGTVDATGSGPRLRTSSGHAFAVPGRGVLPGQDLLYGVRPEHLRLAEAGLPATVAVVEPTGNETHVLARHGEHAVVCVLRERVGLRRGDVVHLAPDPAHVHLFDAATGRRLEAA